MLTKKGEAAYYQGDYPVTIVLPSSVTAGGQLGYGWEGPVWGMLSSQTPHQRTVHKT